jgi:mRNA-degrading endonuclease toxin of MazEF toxin-antitoxin module
MKKDFKEWFDEKSSIHNDRGRVFFHEREIWFASLGANIGFEEDGKGKEFRRPVLVLKKFNNESLWAIPLTKKIKKGKYYFNFTLGDRGTNTAILSQLRMIDSKRLQYKIGVLGDNHFEDIKQKLKLLLA